MKKVQNLASMLIAAGAAVAISGPAFGFFSSEPTGSQTQSQIDSKTTTALCTASADGRWKNGAYSCSKAEEMFGDMVYDQDAEAYEDYYNLERTEVLCQEVDYDDYGEAYYDETCYEEASQEFAEDGLLGIKAWKFFKKKKADNLWYWVEKINHKKARKLARIDEYCADNSGATSYLVERLNGKGRLCGSGFCEAAFSATTLPNCRADCQALYAGFCESNNTCTDLTNTEWLSGTYCADWESTGGGSAFCQNILGCAAGELADSCAPFADAGYMANCTRRKKM